MTKKHTTRMNSILGAAVAMAIAILGPGSLLLGAEATTAPAAATQAVKAKTVTNIWIETDLRQVIQDISAQTDTVIVCDQSVQGAVSMAVKDMSLTDCLERACAVGGYTYTKVKDYYIVGKAEPGQALFQRLAEPQRVKLSHLVPDQIKAMLHSSLQQYVNYDKVSGTVLVTAPEPTRSRILEAIKLFDQPNRQVAIEAIVFELTQDGSKDLALDWRFKTPHVSGSSQNLISTIAYGSTSDLGVYVDVTLRAIVESSKGQVLANPRVLVLNNTEAEIFVGQEKYFSLLSGQASNPYYTLQSIKAGVTLKVTPYIGEEGQISLNLEPEVSDVVADDIRTPGNNPQVNATGLPIVTRRHAKTTIQVKDGQSVLLGGLIRERHRSIIDKVPLAGDIPGIGTAFRSVRDQKEQQEVVILITANIVDNNKGMTDNTVARLEKRYVSPLDAIAAPPQGLPLCN